MKNKIRELIPYVVIIILIILIRSFIATPVRVDGTSMNKNLNDGDILLLYRLAKIERFDIVVLDEKNNKEKMIKRVIGMPGETVEIKNDKIYINGKVIKDKYGFGKTSDYQEIKLDKDEYFLLGDNRLVSKDSRDIGPVKEENIEGVTTIRFFPFNKIDLI